MARKRVDKVGEFQAEQRPMRDRCYQIDVVWKTAFKHKIYCHGHQLKSLLAFNESLEWIKSSVYKEITDAQYKKAMS
jgi:hypothetical protein